MIGGPGLQKWLEIVKYRISTDILIQELLVKIGLPFFSQLMQKLLSGIVFVRYPQSMITWTSPGTTTGSPGYTITAGDTSKMQNIHVHIYIK